jgi:short-subunit dehydrogenase
MEVRNKKIIVTGAASGIGYALVKELLAMGAIVNALDINEANLTKLKVELNNKNLTTYVVDIANKASLNKFKDNYFKANQSVDILINNAGIIQPFVNVEDLTDEDINRVMNINFFGPLNLTRLFLNDLKKQKEAYIVNVSSMGGFFPFPKQTIYGASKAAVKLFTEGLYAECLDTSVKVMVVFPGAIATNITANSNVKVKATNSNYKMTSASVAADTIINGIIKNKFKLYVGSDAKFMQFLYNFNAQKAIKMINDKMKGL